MTTINKLLAVLFIGLTFMSSNVVADDTVQLTLKIIAQNQITLIAVKQVSTGSNSIEALRKLVAMKVKDTAWGPMIISLGGVEALGGTYWAIWVNGDMSTVGAQDVILKDDTTMSLILTSF